MIHFKTEETAIFIEAAREWHGSHQGKSETTVDFNHMPAKALDFECFIPSSWSQFISSQGLDSDKTLLDLKWHMAGSAVA